MLGGLQRILCEVYHLASVAEIKQNDCVINFTLRHPILKGGCDSNISGSGCLGCETCSMLAVLGCYTTGKVVTIKECNYDDVKDMSFVSLEISAK